MAKSNKLQRKSASRHVRATPLPIPSRPLKALGSRKKKYAKIVKRERKDWEDAICSVCLEFPHNAVLLLCSSYNKGCRPYMCATSYRYSNCLEQYKKAYAKAGSGQPWFESTDDLTRSLSTGASNEKTPDMEVLLCPLCRGQVKGWTVVEDARKYLNSKKRTCAHDGCAFVGTHKGLRKHVKGEHPLARPRDVDPALEEKWKRLEHEREHQDVMSTIHSSMPGAVVMGDYVIEGNFGRLFTDINLDGLFGDGPFRVESSGSRGSGGVHLFRGFQRRAHNRLVDFENSVLRRSAPQARRTLPVPRRSGRRRSNREGSSRSLDNLD